MFKSTFLILSLAFGLSATPAQAQDLFTNIKGLFHSSSAPQKGRNLQAWLLNDGFWGTFMDDSAIPVEITGVDVFVLDLNQLPKYAEMCTQPPCFRMEVYLSGYMPSGQYVDKYQVATWITSPGRPHASGGGWTEEGEHKPTWLSRDHKSSAYNNAPMPFSVFYNYSGQAIHGSYDTIDGGIHSHGCIRIKVQFAEKLFSWIQQAGKENTSIHIFHINAYKK